MFDIFFNPCYNYNQKGEGKPLNQTQEKERKEKMKLSETMKKAIAILYAHKTDIFYADDLGIAGGTIQGLEYKDIIISTGKTRDVIIPRKDDPENPIIRQAKEWKIKRAPLDYYYKVSTDYYHNLIYAD